MINQIVQGDCLEVMPNIPDKSVDMILCDLPYGTTACKWDIIIPFEPLWEQYERIIKDNGVIALTASQPFTSALVMSNPKWFRYNLIWEKEQGTDFFMAKKKPLKNFEDVCVFYKKQPVYNPQMTEAGKPWAKKDTGNTFNHIVGKQEQQQSKQSDGNKRYPLSILKFDRPKQSGVHPTQKPVALFEYLIRTYTNEDDTVLDNCIGSGTTAIASLNTGRFFIGIEMDERYHQVATKRVREWHDERGLFT